MKKNLDAYTTTLMMDAMAYAYAMARGMEGNEPDDDELLAQVRGLMTVYCRNENLIPDYSMTFCKSEIEEDEEEEVEEEEENEEEDEEEEIDDEEEVDEDLSDCYDPESALKLINAILGLQ